VEDQQRPVQALQGIGETRAGEIVEKLASITLEEAIQIAETNPLGMDEIFYRIGNAVLGRYYTCNGSEFGGRLLVNSCTPIRFDPGELAALLNRAGGEPA